MKNNYTLSSKIGPFPIGCCTNETRWWNVRRSSRYFRFGIKGPATLRLMRFIEQTVHDKLSFGLFVHKDNKFDHVYNYYTLSGHKTILICDNPALLQHQCKYTFDMINNILQDTKCSPTNVEMWDYCEKSQPDFQYYP